MLTPLQLYPEHPQEAPSPTEPNTPSSLQDDSSAERKSFSSLINYDPSSQTTNANVVSRTTSNAELLKMRLRVAMYKVQTNQVSVPFPNLRNVREGDARERPTVTQAAVEEAIAELRREAQEVAARRQQQTPSAFPTLQPGPVLRPTSYSSRMIYAKAIDLTSSPSPPMSPERLPVASPALYTPQRSLHGHPSTAERTNRPSEQELTSSVVKGRVAEGLLGLRHAA